MSTLRVATLVIFAACGAAPVAVTPAPPATLALPGDANGLYWDAAESALYLTDTTHDTLVRWTDRDGFQPVAQLTGKLSLGGIVRLRDGGFAITSFGFGADGAVIVVDAQHHVTTVPNLDPKRRRVGIARGPDDALYDVAFVVDGKDHHGVLAKLDLAGSETDLAMPGLVKPVGVAATTDGIYVADQDSNTLFVLKGDAVSPVTTALPSADLLAVLPDGALVTGGKTGVVSRIAKDGTITTLAQGYEQVRGIAYDPVGKRLFIVEHAKDPSHRALHVVPLR